MPYVLFCLVCVIWGSSFMLMKLSSPCLTPIEIGAGRAIGGAAVLALMFFVSRRKFTVQKRDVLPLMVVVALGFSWPHSLQPWLVERIGGGLVGMSVGFTPLLTLLVAIPMLGHWPTVRQGLGVLGALVFLMILMREGVGRGDGPSRSKRSQTSKPFQEATPICGLHHGTSSALDSRPSGANRQPGLCAFLDNS